MIERESECAIAEALLTGTAAGPSAYVLLGAAGIGKTTLWRWCVTRARELGFRVLSMRASESEVRLSFGGLVDLLADVDTATLQELPQPQTAALERALLRRTDDHAAADPRAVCLAALSAIRLLADGGPVLVAVDDAQWLDPPTASVLEYVLRRLADEPVVVLVAVRGDPDEPVLPFGLPDAFAGRAVATTIRGLTREGLERLVRHSADEIWSRPLLNQLIEACAGNPFFALELAHARRTGMENGLRWHLPPTLSQLLADRIRSLPDPTFRALLYAAAMSAPTVVTVEAALGDDAGLLDAEAANTVELDNGAIRFTHPLLAAAVYGLASSAQRRQTHRRLAEVVAGAEERAWHLDLATTHADPRVGEALAAAAGSAQARGAPPTAAHLWERAAAHADPSERPGRLARAGECRFFAGDAEGARGLYELAVSETDPGPARARILLDLALIVFYQEGSAEAVALCGRALVEAGEDPLLRAVAYLRTSWYHLNDHTERARCAWLASRELAQVPDPAPADLEALTLVSAAWYGFLAGHGHRGGDVERARRLVPPTSTTREATMTRNALRVFPRYFDPVRAKADFETARKQAAERGDESAAMQSLVMLSEVSGWLGEYDVARAHATRAVEAAEQIGQRTWHPYALYALAAAEAHLGELAAAKAHATDGLRLAGDDSWVAVHQQAVLGFVGLSDGEAVTAARHFAAADELCAATGLADPGICDIEAHLSRVYRKLEVTSRRELAGHELLRGPEG